MTNYDNTIFFHENGQGSMMIDSEDMMDTDNDQFIVTKLYHLHDFRERYNKEETKNESFSDVPEACNEDIQQAKEEPKEPLLEKEENGNHVRRRYTDVERERFFQIRHTHAYHNTAELARLLGINPRTAQKWVAKYEADEEKKIPFTSSNRQSSGPKKKLNEKHAVFIKKFVAEKPLATNSALLDALCSEFSDLKITERTLNNYMKGTCSLSFKQVRQINEKRNHEDTLNDRLDWVLQYRNSNMNYLENCVFIDEASFHLHMVRNQGWSTIGTPVNVEVPSQRGISVTILGAISIHGVINISMREFNKKRSTTKKRKTLGGSSTTEANNNSGRGTKAEHFQKYVESILDVLDSCGLTGLYLVMDNASIHKKDLMKAYIRERGFECVYLPPYSPFLNLIEECWAKIKKVFRSDVLAKNEKLQDRIDEASKQITPSDLRGYIKHSTTFFEPCLRKEKNV